MNWYKNRDGVWTLLVDPESTLTNCFSFTLGKDSTCTAITITALETSTNGSISVLNETLTGNKVFLQTKGDGEVLMILTLSNGDIRRRIRKYEEAEASTSF